METINTRNIKIISYLQIKTGMSCLAFIYEAGSISGYNELSYPLIS